MAWILYDTALQLAGAAAKASDRLRRNDPDLARQLRRAAASVPLNLAEGAARAGRDQLQLYRVALGSAREVKATFEVATVMGYGDFATETALADRVCALARGATR